MTCTLIFHCDSECHSIPTAHSGWIFHIRLFFHISIFPVSFIVYVDICLVLTALFCHANGAFGDAQFFKIPAGPSQVFSTVAVTEFFQDHSLPPVQNLYVVHSGNNGSSFLIAAKRMA